MEPNNFETKIKEALNKRTLDPSAASWDRLDAMLTVTEEKKPKKSFFWISIAASFVVFLGISLFFIQNKAIETVTPKQELVIDHKTESDLNSPTNTISISKNISNEQKELADFSMNKKEQIKKSIPFNRDLKKESLNQPVLFAENQTKRNITTNNESFIENNNSYNYVTPEELLAEVNGQNKETKPKNRYKSSLKVNPNDLLSTAETELNQSFKEKTLAKFREIKSAYANRNLE